MNTLLKSSLLVGALAAGVWFACNKPASENNTAATTPAKKTPLTLTATAGTVKLSPSKDSINPMKDLGSVESGKDSIKALTGAGDSLKFENNLLTVKNLDTIQTKYAVVFTLKSEAGANVTVTPPTDKKLKFALVQRETTSKNILLDSTGKASSATAIPADGNLFLVVQSMGGKRNGGTDSLMANTEYSFTVKAEPKADDKTKDAATLTLKVKWVPTTTATTAK